MKDTEDEIVTVVDFKVYKYTGFGLLILLTSCCLLIFIIDDNTDFLLFLVMIGPGTPIWILMIALGFKETRFHFVRASEEIEIIERRFLRWKKRVKKIQFQYVSKVDSRIAHYERSYPFEGYFFSRNYEPSVVIFLRTKASKRAEDIIYRIKRLMGPNL
ncbi:MAG: hypothetical protein ACFFCS_19030 [Candidatus Hodarchaeota archaeon]